MMVRVPLALVVLFVLASCAQAIYPPRRVILPPVTSYLVGYQPGTSDEQLATAQSVVESALGGTVTDILTVGDTRVSVVHVPKLPEGWAVVQPTADVAIATEDDGSIDIAAASIAAEIQANGVSVQYVEKNHFMRAMVLDEETLDVETQATQSTAPWNLDRLDARSGLDSSYTYADSRGAGVTVYVIDTGILTTHTQFQPRTIPVQSYVTSSSWFGRRTTLTADGNGHGTHCAGTIGASTFGVAKRASLVAVKVLADNGSGATSQVVSGVNWVIGQCRNRTPTRCIISMSLGGPKSTTMDQAVTAASNAGIIVAVAAGNSRANACNESPGGAPGELVLTVGATRRDGDAFDATYSNFGRCVDILAPGTNVPSTWIGSSNTATRTISGTSMATPAVAGVAALIWGANPSWTGAQVVQRLRAVATQGVIAGVPAGTLNAFAYNRF